MDKFPLYKCLKCDTLFNRTIVSMGMPVYIKNYSNALQGLLEITWQSGCYCIICCKTLATTILSSLWKGNH